VAFLKHTVIKARILNPKLLKSCVKFLGFIRFELHHYPRETPVELFNFTLLRMLGLAFGQLLRCTICSNCMMVIGKLSLIGYVQLQPMSNIPKMFCFSLLFSFVIIVPCLFFFLFFSMVTY